MFESLLQTPMFRVRSVSDSMTVEMCGALKNIVAVACGMIDGMEWGNNAKAACLRIGLHEMIRFIK